MPGGPSRPVKPAPGTEIIYDQPSSTSSSHPSLPAIAEKFAQILIRKMGLLPYKCGKQPKKRAKKLHEPLDARDHTFLYLSLQTRELGSGSW